jgi:hypothetical protein
MFGAFNEVDHNLIERRCVFDHQPVRSTGDYDKFSLGDSLGYFFAVSAGGQDVLVAHHH